MAQPTTISHDQLQMTTAATARPIPTLTTPYWEKQQPVIPTPQQPYPPQQHQLPMIETTSPNMGPPIAHTTTNQQSLTTMTKISKTTLAKERKSSNNSNSSRETQMLEIAIQTQMTQQETIRPQEKYQMPQTSRIIQQPITEAMKDTISSSMTPLPMIPLPMIKPNMQEIAHNMMPPDRAMTLQTMTTMPQIMMPLHINTTQQQDNQPILQHHLSQRHRRQQRQLLQQQRQSHHPQQERQQPPRPLVELAPQKAQLNRDRAVALWGHQVQLEESPQQNPICHNSLPRQQPKSSCDPELDLTSNLSSDLIDPFDLEFSISSPSLMRSFGSDTCTEVDDQEIFDEDQQSSDSFTDKTLSPAQTAIRRLTPENQGV